MAAREPHVILGVHITNRLREVQAVQAHLTDFGQCIRTRLGLHALEDGGPSGVLLLEIVGGEKKADELSVRLASVAGVEVKKMVFPHV